MKGYAHDFFEPVAFNRSLVAVLQVQLKLLQRLFHLKQVLLYLIGWHCQFTREKSFENSSVGAGGKVGREGLIVPLAARSTWSTSSLKFNMSGKRSSMTWARKCIRLVLLSQALVLASWNWPSRLRILIFVVLCQNHKIKSNMANNISGTTILAIAYNIGNSCLKVPLGSLGISQALFQQNHVTWWVLSSSL